MYCTSGYLTRAEVRALYTAAQLHGMKGLTDRELTHGVFVEKLRLGMPIMMSFGSGEVEQMPSVFGGLGVTDFFSIGKESEKKGGGSGSMSVGGGFGGSFGGGGFGTGGLGGGFGGGLGSDEGTMVEKGKGGETGSGFSGLFAAGAGRESGGGGREGGKRRRGRDGARRRK